MPCRLNLSTFLSTWMEAEAQELMVKVGQDPLLLLQACTAPPFSRATPRAGVAAAMPAACRLQVAAYNMADAVQYPSAAEMEKRWGGLPVGGMASSWRRRAQLGRAAQQPAALPSGPWGALLCCRCISFLAKLWHCPDDDFVGTGGWMKSRRCAWVGRRPTVAAVPCQHGGGPSQMHHTSRRRLRRALLEGCVGSSEACYLGGLAMKKKWQQARRAAGLPIDRPNLVLSHVAQVCWQKVGGHAGGLPACPPSLPTLCAFLLSPVPPQFCVYFDVEPHYVDVTHDCLGELWGLAGAG